MEHNRKCISCGEIKPRKELIKITKEHLSGNIVIQPDSKTFGRSVYLCYNENCISMAFRKNRIYKMLKTSNNVDKEVLLGLTQPTKE